MSGWETYHTQPLKASDVEKQYYWSSTSTPQASLYHLSFVLSVLSSRFYSSPLPAEWPRILESEVSAEFDKIRGKWSSRDRFGPIFGSDGALGSTSRAPAACYLPAIRGRLGFWYPRKHGWQVSVYPVWRFTVTTVIYNQPRKGSGWARASNRIEMVWSLMFYCSTPWFVGLCPYSSEWCD